MSMLMKKKKKKKHFLDSSSLLIKSEQQLTVSGGVVPNCFEPATILGHCFVPRQCLFSPSAVISFKWKCKEEGEEEEKDKLG